MKERLESSLGKALKNARRSPAPPKLAVMDYAIFPVAQGLGRSLLWVARACGLDSPELAMASAVSVEFMHCASLVHDDLPAFDNADTRRGKPSVHKAFDEPLAILCGDALIVLAFESLATASLNFPERLGPMIGVLARSSGMPTGICSDKVGE